MSTSQAQSLGSALSPALSQSVGAARSQAPIVSASQSLVATALSQRQGAAVGAPASPTEAPAALTVQLAAGEVWSGQLRVGSTLSLGAGAQAVVNGPLRWFEGAMVSLRMPLTGEAGHTVADAGWVCVEMLTPGTLTVVAPRKGAGLVGWLRSLLA